MFPDNLKQLFGLKNEKDLGMANNIWKMLDQMAQNSPQQYKQFIQKNIHEGVQQVKTKKDEKDKPYKLKPQKGFLLQFDVILNEKIITTSHTKNNQIEQIHHKLGQKLEDKLYLNQEKWIQVKKKFKNKLHILLNVCYSDRVKLPLDKTQKVMQNINLNSVKDIEVFYYSLQGPKQINNKNSELNELQYVMIVNKKVFQSLMGFQQVGKKMLMSLTISYFEQRLQNDRNPLLKHYNVDEFKKLAFYSIQKMSIELNSQRNYFYDNKSQIDEFLLETEVDIKREGQAKSSTLNNNKNSIKEAKHIDIKFKQQPNTNNLKAKNLLIRSQRQNNSGDRQQLQQSSSKQQQEKLLLKQDSNQKNQQKKKPLIQVLKQTQTETQIESKLKQLPFELKLTGEGYHVEILCPGVKSLEEINLEINEEKIKLKINQFTDSQITQISLEKMINVDLVRAKFKKKLFRLVIDAPFLNKKNI